MVPAEQVPPGTLAGVVREHRAEPVGVSGRDVEHTGKGHDLGCPHPWRRADRRSRRNAATMPGRAASIAAVLSGFTVNVASSMTDIGRLLTACGQD